jgi:hypothetical protein
VGKEWTSLNVHIGSGQTTRYCNIAVFGDDAMSRRSRKAPRAGSSCGAGKSGHKMSGLNVAATHCRPIDLRAKVKRTARTALALIQSGHPIVLGLRG